LYNFIIIQSQNIVLQNKESIQMNKKNLGIALLVVGVVVLVVSLAADMIGIGGNPGFGTKQILGAGAGVVVAVVGFVLYSRK
jgi:hypothetical protein